MGRCPNHKKPSKNRYSHKSARRSKFLVKGDDLIHQDIQKQGLAEVLQPLDEDLPGLAPNLFENLSTPLNQRDFEELHVTSPDVELVDRWIELGFMRYQPVRQHSGDLEFFAGYSRYFGSATAQDDHFKTKRHKKRVKTMQGPAPHTQLDADLAAGMGRPDNGPRLIQ